MSTNTLNKIENFIEALSLPESIAKGVLRTEEDCKAFYIDFYGRNRYVADDLLDYREKKIRDSDITLINFIKKCDTNLVEAFESTFYQSFTDRDMKLVTDAIANGKTTLQALFLDFKKNPNRNVLKNVL